jgi:hypothetical protein
MLSQISWVSSISAPPHPHPTHARSPFVTSQAHRLRAEQAACNQLNLYINWQLVHTVILVRSYQLAKISSLFSAKLRTIIAASECVNLHITAQRSAADDDNSAAQLQNANAITNLEANILHTMHDICQFNPSHPTTNADKSSLH